MQLIQLKNHFKHDTLEVYNIHLKSALLFSSHCIICQSLFCHYFLLIGQWLKNMIIIFHMIFQLKCWNNIGSHSYKFYWLQWKVLINLIALNAKLLSMFELSFLPRSWIFGVLMIRAMENWSLKEKDAQECLCNPCQQLFQLNVSFWNPAAASLKNHQQEYVSTLACSKAPFFLKSTDNCLRTS